MVKVCFREKRFAAASQALIAACDAIITEYDEAGYRLTLRQLYYQLVTKNVIPNVERSYKNLSTLVSDARLAGLLDWDAIEDRGRSPRSQSFWRDAAHVVQAFKGTAQNFKMDPWEGQPCYVELWVEKDALAGVLAPLAEEHGITLMVNKGYSSQSAMYESAQRFIDHNQTEGKDGALLYLGDHDPSGEDMVRDIRERLEMFGAEVEVRKVALTMAQVRQYNPPPNPAKISDPRAADYIAKHGNQSWEVDALPPRVLGELITRAVQGFVDLPTLRDMQDKETAQRKWLLERLKAFK